MKPKIGLALSGGGVPGACVHAGFVDAIRERYDIVEVSGASAGAIVASAYACFPGACMKDLVLEHLTNRVIVAKASIFQKLSNGAYYKSKHLRKILGNIFEGATPEIDLHIVTANLSTRQEHVFTNPSDVTECIMASAAIPVLLPGVRIDGDLHVDGGLVKNLPLDVLSERHRVGAYFPDDGQLEPGLVGYIEALVGTIVNGNVVDEIDDDTTSDIVPLKKVGAMLPYKISIDDAHHLCLTGYRLGRDYLAGR